MANEGDKDTVLGEELGKLGGEIGGVGARWAAHGMPNNAFRASVDLEISTRQALAEFSAVGRALGRVIEQEETDAGATLRAVIGAGFWNLNPAVVEVQIEPLGPQTCPPWRSPAPRRRGSSSNGLAKGRSARCSRPHASAGLQRAAFRDADPGKGVR